MIKLRHTSTVSITTGTIAASGSYTTDPYDCAELEGYFSLQWTIVGSGTMKVEVLISNDGGTFTEIDPDITTGQTVGTSITDFIVTPCNQFKLKFTETAGAANTIAVTARLRAF